mgnify:CR=1 FL=1
MTKRFIARLLLIAVGVVFIWDEFDRARWVKWFKNGGF